MSIQTITDKKATYHILKTQHKGFVVGQCLVPMGKVYANYEDQHLLDMVSAMLSLGTKNKSEETINAFLEDRGISCSFANSSQNLMVTFQCLKKHLDDTIALIMEQLMEPAFDQDCFNTLIQRKKGMYNSVLDNVGYQGQSKFIQTLFPKTHISYVEDAKDMLAYLDEVSLENVVDYHQNNIHSGKIVWNIAGDVPDNFQSICEKHTPDREASLEIKRESEKVELISEDKKFPMKDKQSVDLRMGHILDINNKHKDYLPLVMALDILGGGFSARLMRTVRDEEGLTYGVGSSLVPGILDTQCYWVVSGSFAPTLLEQGMTSIKKQLHLWVEEGVSLEEFEERKAGLLGKYQVMLSDASSLVGKISSSLEMGFDAEYLYTYCDKIEQVSLDDVNRVIKQYIQLDKMTVVSTGSV